MEPDCAVFLLEPGYPNCNLRWVCTKIIASGAEQSGAELKQALWSGAEGLFTRNF